jgi:AmmeMemoRadiSam system radical SAM enzyme/AmmeMemoRadiSam system protein B/AmmeMemoRadiSam system protein A
MSDRILLPPSSTPRAEGLPGGWWHRTEDGERIVCDLCPRACTLKPGDKGFCFVRENQGGEMVLTTYGRSTGFCIDPVEKKPLNHFYPGTSILSFGTAGCNLGCKFCQNWSISKSREVELLSESASPEAIATAALKLGCRSVAFTYNDPVVWAEYAIDTAKACRAAGVKTVAVTAGYITPEARGPFYEFMDAANVDLKGFTEDFYQHLTLSHLEPVLDTLKWLKHESDVWFEITNLIIPDANDSPDELKQMCDWILSAIGPDVPVHFTAFHPDFRLRDRGRTPVETLLAAYEIGRAAGLNYLYVGNVSAPKYQTTFCPACQKSLIERDGYEILKYQIQSGACRHCGAKIAGRFDETPGNWGSRRQPVRISQFQPPTLTRRASEDSSSLSSGELPVIPSSGQPQSQATAPLTSEQERAILSSTAAVMQRACRGESTSDVVRLGSDIAHRGVWGVFTTLKRCGRLRSCAGVLGSIMQLGEGLARAAKRTSCDDERFPPLAEVELSHLDLDVWLLDDPQPLRSKGPERIHEIVIGKHGLQIARGEARGLLLPGVAVEAEFTPEQFLDQVAIKAGLPPSAWREPDTQVWRFEGKEIVGKLADYVPRHPPDHEPLAPRYLEQLRVWCQQNYEAHRTGATPNYYAWGIEDIQASGVLVRVVDMHAATLGEAHHFSLREASPLQATLYQLTESVARRIPAAHATANSARVELCILATAAMHGSVVEPDLRGIDPQRRALLVLDRGRAALVHHPEQSPELSLDWASQSLGGKLPAAKQVFSLVASSTLPTWRTVNAPQPRRGASVREPAVAGQFYPGDAKALSAMVDEMLSGPEIPKQHVPAVMVPHAGLKYSGHLAADVLRRVQIPSTVIVIGPKHTPHGVDWAVAPQQTWKLPGMTLDSDVALAEKLCAAIPGLEMDAAAHAQEHAIEVELPFIAKLSPETKVVGIAIGAGDYAACREFAQGLANIIRELREPPLLIISSDMNHFASDSENRRLDELALAAMESLDASDLLETTQRHHISMCGVLPAVIVMETLRLLGQLHQCQRIGYATSADVTGDKTRVVGYAGMLLS